MGNFKKERKMKVYAQSGYKYKDTARRIKGFLNRVIPHMDTHHF